MSDLTPDPDALETAHELTEALGAMTGQLRAVQRELQAVNERLARAEKRQDRADNLSKRIRHLVAALIVSFCLDLAVTAGFGYNTVRLNDTQNAARQTLVTACRGANVNRAEDIAVWNTFFTVAAPPASRTPKVRELIAAIDAKVRIKDRPRDCISVYGTR